MSYYLRKFKKNVLLHRTRMRRFLSKVEKSHRKVLDAHADEIQIEVWKQTDCLACSNCCRTMTPTFNFQDLRRISAHFGMSINAFKEKWLYKNKDGEWMNRSQPCQFLNLKDNKCSIYEVRPEDCASFPHLHKRKMVDYMHWHKQNVQHCPATFNMVERMIQKMTVVPLSPIKKPQPNISQPVVVSNNYKYTSSSKKNSGAEFL